MLCPTGPEALYVQRRRLQISQAERAAQLKIPEYLYVDYENEKRDVPKKLVPKMRVFSDIEECVIKRRRCHMTQEDVAKELGMSRLWVNRMEQGTEPAERLIEFWRKG